jgi:hypothetical protein
LPNEKIAKAWMEYVKDTKVTDTTPPPAPTNVRLQGNKLTWELEADLESGLASVIIERDGQFLANVPEHGKNPFGRPIFQNLQYSDTPTQPLVPMQFTDTRAEPGKKHTYRVIAVNTVGLKSEPSAKAAAKGDIQPSDAKDRPNVRFPLQVSKNRRYLVDPNVTTRFSGGTPSVSSTALICSVKSATVGCFAIH